MGTSCERWEEACPSLAAKLSPKAHTGCPGTACGYGRRASTGRYTDGPTWPVSSQANLPIVEFTWLGKPTAGIHRPYTCPPNVALETQSQNPYVNECHLEEELLETKLGLGEVIMVEIL